MTRRPSVAGPPLVTAFGDGAVLADLGDVGAAHRLAHLIQSERDSGMWPWLEDVVVGFGTVTAVVDPWRAELDDLLESVRRLVVTGLSAATDSVVAEGAHGADGGDGAHDVLEIPVRFDGPDLDEVSARAGLRPGEVVSRLAAAELQVAFVGFSPGFAYLTGLPPELASVPRRSRPRPLVPAGSVAMGGGFAGIYPQPTPGGWNLVGRTDAVLFDPTRPPFAVLRPGQRVRLMVSEDDVVVSSAPSRRPLTAGPDTPALTVELPGACTLVQDAGRRGVAALGVPRAGAADQLSLRLANRLVGNDDEEAVLEVTGRGPALRASADLHVAVLGDLAGSASVEVLLDGRPVPEAQVLPVSRGQVLETRSTGAAVRAVVAVSGGIDIEPLLGSRSSDLLSGLGPGPLRAGDVLAVGRGRRPRGGLHWSRHAPAVRSLRVLAGPDAPGGSRGDGVELERLLGGEWLVSPAGNRVGVRFTSGAPDVPLGAGGTSRGMVTGAVQLPPGGEAIVLGPDHATVGGYPVIAVVVTADLHHLAHLAPGSSVRFEVVGQSDAQSARGRLRADEADAVQGWFPTRAD